MGKGTKLYLQTNQDRIKYTSMVALLTTDIASPIVDGFPTSSSTIKIFYHDQMTYIDSSYVDYRDDSDDQRWCNLKHCEFLRMLGGHCSYILCTYFGIYLFMFLYWPVIMLERLGSQREGRNHKEYFSGFV